MLYLAPGSLGSNRLLAIGTQSVLVADKHLSKLP